MSKHWRDVVKKIDKEIDKIAFEPPAEVLKIYKFGIITSGAGTNGQYFTTLVFTEGVCRSLAYDCVNNLVYMAEEESFTLDQLKIMVKQWLTSNAQFLGYCGLKYVWDFALDIFESLETMETKEDFLEVINAYNLYLACMHSWIHHFFPWNIGVLFPLKKPEELREMMQYLDEL